MEDKNWAEFGEEIKRTVQSSIEKQDYRELTSTVNKLVNGALDSINQSIKNAGNNGKRQDTNGTAPGQMGSGASSPGQTKNNTTVKAGQNTVSGTAPKYRSGHMGTKNYGNASTTQVTRRQMPVSPFYASTSMPTTVGILMSVFGVLGAGTFAVTILIYCIMSLIVGVAGATLSPAALIIFGILFAGCVALATCGIRKLGFLSRFRRYCKEIGNRVYYSVRELAGRTGRSESFIKNDLKKMVAQHLFLQGHLDEQETCLIVSEEAYKQYQISRQQYLQREQEAKAKQLSQQQEEGKLPDSVKKVIEEGQKFIEQIHQSNEAIRGEDISRKISRMEDIVQKIFQQVKERPELVGDIRKLMDYYLPTTIKLLDAYQELDRQPVQGPNITSSKQEIEGTMDTLNQAFENLLDGFFQNKAWDISSDISVLNTMLAQEGLKDSDFKTEEQPQMETPNATSNTISSETRKEIANAQQMQHQMQHQVKQ